MSDRVLKAGVAVYSSPDSNNLGDHVQALGMESAVRAAFGEDTPIIRIRRDQASQFDEPGVPVVASGWLTHAFLPDFVPSRPSLFKGVHFTPYARGRLSAMLAEGRKVFAGEVGARDRSTMEWCASAGVPAYFMRCVGFCVPRPRLTGDKVFLVDVLRDYDRYLPYGGAAVRVSQRAWPCAGSVVQARMQLERYAREARLVVTSALHAAVPCVAMGIPVVVLRPQDANDFRFETLDGIVPVNDVSACEKGSVDFEPKPVDTTALAADIVADLRLSVLKSLGEQVDESELAGIRGRIAGFRG